MSIFITLNLPNNGWIILSVKWLEFERNVCKSSKTLVSVLNYTARLLSQFDRLFNRPIIYQYFDFSSFLWCVWSYMSYIYNVFGFCRTHQEDVVLCFRYLRRTLTNCFWHADSNIYWLIEKLIGTWIDNWSNPWLQPFKKCSYSCYSDSDKRNITLRRLKRANFEHFALKIDFTPNWLSKSWWSTDWFSSTPYSK